MTYNFYTYDDLNLNLTKENIYNSKYDFSTRLTLNKYTINISDTYKERSKNAIFYIGISRKF
jgi:hypothetical protein